MPETPTAAAPASLPADARRSPWRWVPSLYFAQGLPYVVVMIVSVIMYKRLGISNTDIALYTSWLYLPWVIKPFWSPVVEVLRTKRFWTVAMQVLVGGGLAGVALTLPAPDFFRYSLAFLWLLAFASATHDIAADGFYMLALSERDQAWFVGIRSTFYRAAMITGQGLLVILAGALESATGMPPALVEVRAVEAGTGVAVMPAEAPSSDAVQLVPSAREVAIPLGTVPSAEVDAVVAEARRTNALAGFYGPEAQAAARAEAAAEARAAADTLGAPEGSVPEAPPAPEPEGWWSRNISGPLGRWITANFGRPPVEAPANAGRVAVVEYRLSQPLPEGETAVVNLRQSGGDKSVRLVEGERLEFSPATAGQAARVVVGLDHRLRAPTAATFEARSGNVPLAWSLTFFILAGVFLGLTAWHAAALPRPATDRPAASAGAGALGQYLVFLVAFAAVLAVVLIPMMLWGIVGGLLRREAPWGRLFRALPFADSPFAEAIVTFFEKPGIATVVAFILLYRFAEAHLVKLASPFLLDTTETGGLALSTGEVGFVYGTVGVAGLVAGGILGGILASRDGLKRWFWPMVLAINVPNAVYVYLSTVRPDSFALINGAVALETFGYGFGFTAFLLYLIHASEGTHKTAHYAICTGFMALGMMIPGMYSGWLEDLIGYERFFVWVVIATIPSFLVASLVRIDPEFGKRDSAPAPTDEPPTATAPVLDDAPERPTTGAGTPTGASDDASTPA